jgi:hypothetical protein
MKKYLLIFLTIILVSTTHAYGFKLMAGGHLAKYAVEPAGAGVEWKYKTGFLAGAGIELFSVPHISLDIDGFFFRKGSKYKSASEELDYTLDVISITPLIRVKFLPGSSPYVLGGAEFSSILTHKSDDIDIKANYKKFDYGVIFGAGYRMSMPGGSLFFEARYHFGVANILKNPASGESLKTRALVIIVGLKI